MVNHMGILFVLYLNISDMDKSTETLPSNMNEHIMTFKRFVCPFLFQRAQSTISKEMIGSV